MPTRLGAQFGRDVQIVAAAQKQHLDKHAESGENGVKAAAQRKSRMKKLERLGEAGVGKSHEALAQLEAEMSDFRGRC